jgi:hypothetical protein
MIRECSTANLGSSDRLKIPSTTPFVAATYVSAHPSIREVIFDSISRGQTIDGFRDSRSLSRIIIPSFVDLARFDALSG